MAAVRRTVLIFVCFVVGVFGKISRQKWNSLFKSKADRIYESDDTFVTAQEDVLRSLSNPLSEHYTKPHLHVLHFASDCDTSCHNAVRDFVGNVNYNPINSHDAQVYISPNDLNRLRLDHATVVADATPLLPSLKYTSSLTSTCSSSMTLLVSLAPMSRDDLSVTIAELASHFPTTAFQDPLHKLQSETRESLALRIPCKDVDTAVHFLSHLKDVQWIEDRPPIIKHNRWATAVCQSGNSEDTPIFAANLTGLGQIVGIADTGIDMFHCQFYDDKVDPPYDTVNNNHRKVVYYDTYQDDTDTDGHGTHVAASAAGKSYLDYGDYVKYNGNAPEAKIAFFDIGNSGGSLQTPGNLYTGLFLPLYNAGARVQSHSWGYPASSSSIQYTSESAQVDSFMKDYPDALILFAGGNNGEDSIPYVTAPSTNKNGICVGASLNAYDSWKYYLGPDTSRSTYDLDHMAGFSAQGPTPDGRLKPDLAAPGAYVTSAAYTTSGSLTCGAAGMTGTSMATPTVAGNAMLIREYFLRGFYPSGSATTADSFNPSGALVKAMLVHSGRDTPDVTYKSGSTGTSGGYPSVKQGYGRIELDRVLNFGSSEGATISLMVIGAVDVTSSLYKVMAASGQTHTYTINTSDDGAPLRFTMAFTDAAGSPGTSAVNVNDLDLTVSNDTHTFSPYFESDADKNTVEMIDIDSPAPNSTYTVTITAVTVVGTQTYALVVTGSVTEYEYKSNSTVFEADNTRLNAIPKPVENVIIVFSIIIVALFTIVASIYCSVKKAQTRKPDNMSDELYQTTMNL